MFAPATTAAATLSDVSLRTRGDFVELLFFINGSEPAWSLQTRQHHLAITLDQTRVALHAPMAKPLVTPVTGLSIDSNGGTGLISIAVAGKVDYAATFSGHELIVRLARAGAAADIDTPLRIVHAAPRNGASVTRHPLPRLPTSQLVAREPARVPTIALAAPPMEQPAAYVPLQPRTEPQPQRSYSPIVVIDPGHGGHDPGTISADGVMEKDVALQIALRVHNALQAQGIAAPMTRSDDRFISLAERTQFANRAHADLFLSIHMNSSPDRNTSGMEVYYLNNTTDRATMRLAQMENGATPGYGDSASPNLHYILDDLTQGNKAHESVALAQMVETDSTAQLKAETGITMNRLGVKRGPFYVLVGAEMPAVLVECGFLSNNFEASRLVDARYQQALADGIAAAMLRYLNNDMAVGNL
jgi:N-acetylmuramoyl-L-alanine amidase